MIEPLGETKFRQMLNFSLPYSDLFGRIHVTGNNLVIYRRAGQAPC